jgi:hypothetical protein
MGRRSQILPTSLIDEIHHNRLGEQMLGKATIQNSTLVLLRQGYKTVSVIFYRNHGLAPFPTRPQ